MITQVIRVLRKVDKYVLPQSLLSDLEFRQTPTSSDMKMIYFDPISVCVLSRYFTIEPLSEAATDWLKKSGSTFYQSEIKQKPILTCVRDFFRL